MDPHVPRAGDGAAHHHDSHLMQSLQEYQELRLTISQESFYAVPCPHCETLIRLEGWPCKTSYRNVVDVTAFS